jgi:murein DD-endopeptidase MepM/ murein hydrolase activator NlpD
MKQIVNELTKQLKVAFRQGSNPVSAILRLFLEKRQARNLFGSQLIALTVVYGVVAVPIHAFDYTNTRPQYVNGSVFVPVTTETTYQIPVLRSIGISQGYGRFHPALDIRAPRGSEVVAMSDGIVIDATHTSTGYGKYIRILHDGNTISLYAHLDSMSVKSGDSVTKGQQIGTIGMTGWTTGPHLHFEITQDGRYVDPMSVVR